MKRFIVEEEYEYQGYKCVVIFNYLGHRCGYVGVDKTHPLYKVDYGQYLNIKKADLPAEMVVSGTIPLMMALLDEDERIKIDAYFQVHGGITYSGGGVKSEYPIESDLWWFGFDCGHYGDKNDYELAIKTFPERRETHLLEMAFENMCNTGGEIRTLEYVKSECENLALQLEQYKDFAEGKDADIKRTKNA